MKKTYLQKIQARDEAIIRYNIAVAEFKAALEYTWE